MNNGIQIRIKADSIYRTSVSTIYMSCDSFFIITNQSDSTKILTIQKGNTPNSSNTIEAVKNSYGKYELEFIIIGLFHETKFKRNIKCIAYDCTYGTFLYPFLSSQLCWKFESQNNLINNIIIELPDSYRLLFYKSIINSQGNSGFSSPQQSFDLPNTLHIFTRKKLSKNKSSDKINMNIPIRLGGKDFHKLVSSPVLFSFLSIISVFLCSIYIKDYITPAFASVLALWSFLFERYNNSSVPQGQTLMKKLYGFLTIIALLAFISICVFHSLRVKLFCFLFFSFFILLIRLSLSFFYKNNSLPVFVELLFEFIISFEDKYNKNVRKIKKDEYV